MVLSQENLKEQAWWHKAGFSLPQYDRGQICRNTRQRPTWLHLGAGNIFRALLANVQQDILNRGLSDTGIIAASGHDFEALESLYRVRDNLTALVTLHADGSIEKTIIGSIAETLAMDPSEEQDWQRLREILQAPSLQMISLTITEKSYNLRNADGSWQSQTVADFAGGPMKCRSYMAKVTALLYQRFLAGRLPLAVVSMDNCSHNGSRLAEAVLTFAAAWEQAGMVQQGFSSYLQDSNCIGFPWTMIDKITPRPDERVKEMLEAVGFTDTTAVLEQRSAPFVNAEAPQYLVMEDHFPNGHPPLEEAGIFFTDRQTVELAEKMKVCTCLNPLHTALAIFGCLLGYTRISDEMKDRDLVELVEGIGYREGLPVAANPGILDPHTFLDEVLHQRFPNPFLPDTPQRIATDTSQKLSIRFGETIKAYLHRSAAGAAALTMIPLTLAGWCRYLLAVDDTGRPFKPSSDPLLATCQASLAGIELGDARDFHTELAPILSNASIFGVDLYQASLGAKVEEMFAQLVAGPGAVRLTLQRYTRKN
jgi:fructuronate reductase